MIYLVELQFLETVCKEDGILDHWKVNRRCEKEGGTFQPPEHKYLGKIVKVLFLFLSEQAIILKGVSRKDNGCLNGALGAAFASSVQMLSSRKRSPTSCTE